MSEAEASSYMAWNDALAARYFHPEAAGQQVYLYVTEDVIRDVGRPLGGGVDEFIAAVRAGPPGATRSGHCQRALRSAEGWRERGLAYPPYVAYLALFVLAGGHEGAFAAHAYYPRLWELLGERGEGSPPSFDRMIELWDDLERWSTQDLDGQLGIFEARIVGGWVHVGLPLAQTVLTEAERRALPKVFAAARLDPDAPSSTRDLHRAVVQYGRPVLRPRTVSAVERGSEAFKRAVLDVIAGDYLEWDGQVPAPTGPSQRHEIQAALRLCLAVDRVAGVARARLRCHARVEFPDEGLRLEGAGAPLRGAEYLPGWSHPVSDMATGTEFVPPEDAWQAGLVLADLQRGWHARLRPARIRPFVSGEAEGLPGLVEQPGLPQRRPFYLAFRAEDWARLQPWAEEDCTGWREIPISSGLPSGWRLATVGEARTDRGPSILDPRAAFPDRIGARLAGGIRSSAAGNTFFPFAPPRLVVDGIGPAEAVYCQDGVLDEDRRTPGTYTLPGDLPTDTRIAIEIRRGEETIRRLSLYLATGVSWRLHTPVAALDSCGEPLADASSPAGIAGAAVAAAAEPFRHDLLRTPGLSPAARKIYFIGNTPGAVAVWPAEPLPPWNPVWAVAFNDHGRPLYCGTSLAQVRPTAGRAGSHRQAKTWRQVLWRWRRRITPPPDQPFKALWREYREAARDS
ncbi:MAG TPA: hypothetical protein VFC00_00180 [Micromonosporaceae bacterium]|nr:hypothetical protein [Micromonosporaceae bacterium]